VIIRPDVTGMGALDRVDVRAVVKRGEVAIQAALTELRRTASWPNRVRRKLFGDS